MSNHQAHLSHPKYRPDIDGLRAIAVLSVVAFHAFPNWVKGGFVGVDVFFVISGFLISTIIFENLDKGTFSFGEFYARRIKRIFPALLLVFIASYAFGWFALLADEYKQLGKHIAGGAGFVSNFILWNEAGYFDNSAETKPLLHLWSLGIEEQFYIAWPLLLWLAWKGKLNFLIITIFIAFISFALNIKGAHKDAVATFYSPQTRFWELLCGSVLAWVTLYKKDAFSFVKKKLDTWLGIIFYREQPEPDGKTLSNFLSFLGLSLLTWGFYIISKELAFPGKWALAPALGAVLIISAGQETWLNRTVLSNRLMVWFGLISFPLYLWHWPLLSFMRVVESETPSSNIRIAAVVLAIVLAWLTYVLVERPVRFGKHGKTKIIALVVLMLATGYVGYNTYSRDGLLFRSAHQLHAENYSLLVWNDLKTQNCDKRLGSSSTFCLELGNINNQKLAIIGDSTGNSLAPGLAKLYASKGVGVINLGSWTCPPIRGLVETENWGKKNGCLLSIDNAYRLILSSQTIDAVVLAFFVRDLQFWGVPGLPVNASLESKFEVVKSLLSKDINELKSRGKKVIVTYDTPFNPIRALDCIARPFKTINSKKCDISESDLIDRQPYLKLFDDYFKGRGDVCIVRQSNILIKNNKSLFFDETGKLLLRDTHHLTYYGSSMIANEFISAGCLDAP